MIDLLAGISGLCAGSRSQSAQHFRQSCLARTKGLIDQASTIPEQRCSLARYEQEGLTLHQLALTLRQLRKQTLSDALGLCLRSIELAQGCSNPRLFIDLAADGNTNGQG